LKAEQVRNVQEALEQSQHPLNLAFARKIDEIVSRVYGWHRSNHSKLGLSSDSIVWKKKL
jgi:hypothetical protein